ncbi:hypothetical protein BI322_08180 [Klebsiella oxytoca]|nr:hypothetical protein BI322_08180 [Klebsiella oxytoca]
MGIASSYKCIHFLEGVILVVLTEKEFRFSLLISQLLAKAIPVRGAKFEKPAFEAGFLLFCILALTQNSIQPGKHFIYHSVWYAFQPHAIPGSHINGSGLVAANNANRFCPCPCQ